MVETAIQHKIQSSWVGSICSYWRNSTKSLIRSKSRSDQISETVKLKNTEGTELLNWLISSQIWALFRSVRLKKFCLFAANHADLSFISLITRLSYFWSKTTLFSAFFAQKHIVVYWQLSWAALGKISRQRTFSFFVAKLRCFKLFYWSCLTRLVVVVNFILWSTDAFHWVD